MYFRFLSVLYIYIYLKNFTLILYFRESQGKNERRRVEAKEVRESLLKIKIYEIYN